MRAKAIVDLCQLSDPDLFGTVSAGLRVVLANALNLHRQAVFAGRAGHEQGGVILGGFAQEEAAKFHVLMDAIRCPRGEVFANHLRKHFYDHLARGIYAEQYDHYPANFGEVRSHVDDARVALYLDGPEGFDWIFRNQIVERREQQIYVDYVQADEERHWVRPNRFLCFAPHFPPTILSIARALASAGITAAPALAVVANLWRPFQICDGTSWGELHKMNTAVLTALQDHGLLRQGADTNLIRERWAFPLFGLDLTEDRSVTISDLRRVREEAEVRWIAREVGYPY
jgi:AbiV family abortive infection protein